MPSELYRFHLKKTKNTNPWQWQVITFGEKQVDVFEADLFQDPFL